MTHKHPFTLAGFLLITALLCLWIGLAAFPPAAQAGPTLPPRGTPTPAPEGGKAGKKDKPAGAVIELEVAMVPANVWAAVQWQDSAGNWHEVEGWRGTLAGSGRWWVHPKDFGTGPFRWVVTAGPGGPLLGSSLPFDLPGAANQVVRVALSPGAP